MEEKNIIIEEYKKPLIEIDNDLIELRKNIKIINSLKDDIEEQISFLSNNKNINKEEIISLIKDKYNKIKTQIKKFMNKRKFIYNFIDSEKLAKKNIPKEKNVEDENEKLLEEKDKLESATQNIDKMKKEITKLANNLDKTLSELNILENKDELIKEIELNDIKYDDKTLNEQNQIKSSILNIKAEIYDEETKELEKANKIISQIKKGTADMKMITSSQGNTINNLLDEHNYIGRNIEKGRDELNENKNRNQNNNSKLGGFLFCLIILIIIFSCFLYYKFKK